MEWSEFRMAYLALLLSLLYLCASLNDEGRALLRFRERMEVDPYGALSNWEEGSVDPCAWFGVECSDDGRVIALNLKDLCLKGTLAPELGKLVHMKSLILYNNSFCGTIPRKIGELQKLEVLDLGHNNLSGPLPSDLGSILSLEILVLRSNEFIGNIPPELHELNMLSELQVDEELSSSNRVSVTKNIENATIRRLLQEVIKPEGKHHGRQSDNTVALASTPSQSPMPLPPFSSSSPMLPPSPAASTPSNSFPPPPSYDISTPGPSPSKINEPSHPKHPPKDAILPSTHVPIHPPSGSPWSSVVEAPQEKHKTNWVVYVSIAAGASFLVALCAVCFLCCRANKVATVMPWRTGLSGQLQKAFVTGVPSLKRSELESACEDFSNIVGSLSDCMLYKGTLSSGVEIVVTSSMVTSAKDWLDQSESQFRKKISVLSKVNHKNFMNLLGYCEEDEPFTRMMVYEYTPNGTLFEHLHIKEAEHLDWAARLRVIMGISYCLEHMHQLNPPVILKNLHSSSIYLSNDYAAKISDLSFWNEEKGAGPASESSGVLDEQFSNQESIVYKFGIILLEIISGRLPFSEDDGLLVLWASSYLTGKRTLKNMVDSTLKSFSEEDVSALCQVIRSCINPDPKERPTMAEVTAQLRQITAMPPDRASPKLSPLWWAELDIISTEANSLG